MGVAFLAGVEGAEGFSFFNLEEAAFLAATVIFFLRAVVLAVVFFLGIGASSLYRYNHQDIKIRE